MAKLWLPLAETDKHWKIIQVTEGGFTMPVFVPIVEDRSEQRDLDDFALENTQSQLRKKQPKPIAKTSKKDIAGALRDYREWFLHKKETGNNRVF